jgi:hypothetical protein
MLHPALAQALATAHIEDLQRAAARRHAIRAARSVATTTHGSNFKRTTATCADSATPTPRARPTA